MRALADVVGASPGAAKALSRMRLDGMTDRRIARILCAAQAHSENPDKPVEEHAKSVSDEEIDRVLDLYLQCLREGMENPEGFQVLDGVVDMLGKLEQDPQVVLALGTGNLEEGAKIKLKHAQLWDRFHFGGFACDAEERPDILRAAWRKAEAHLGRQCQAEDFVVIGDTPRDVAAAHVLGIRAVAVASGRHSVSELASSGADAVLDTLARPDALSVVLSKNRR